MPCALIWSGAAHNGIVRARIADDVRSSVTVMGWPQLAEGLAKTAGFVSGVVWLDAALEARFGVGALL